MPAGGAACFQLDEVQREFVGPFQRPAGHVAVHAAGHLFDEPVGLRADRQGLGIHDHVFELHAESLEEAKGARHNLNRPSRGASSRF